MEMTLTIPDELASRLQPLSPQLAHILELGIREWNAQQEPGFRGVEDILETLANLPAPEEIMALRPSQTMQTRISELLEKNRTVGLLPQEQREWDRYQYAEHLVRLAKAHAAIRLKRN
jgi:hypothetical protein